mgnify:CR=1 FL=1
MVDVIVRSLFVIVSQAEGERKAFHEQVIEGGLVIQGCSVGRDVVLFQSGISFGQVIHRHGIVHTLPEAESTEQPFVSGIGGRFDVELLGEHLLLHVLTGEISALRGEVLVDALMVGDGLESHLILDAISFPVPFHTQARGGHASLVEAIIVVVHFARSERFGVAHGIRITALIRPVVRAGQTERKLLLGLPFQADACRARLAIIGFLTRVLVGEESVRLVVIARDGDAEFLAQLPIVRHVVVLLHVVSEGSPKGGSFVSERRLRIDVDDASHGVSSVEGTLRATEHFHAGYLAEVEIEGRLLEVGDAIHVKSYRGRIDFRSDTSDEDR